MGETDVDNPEEKERNDMRNPWLMLAIALVSFGAATAHADECDATIVDRGNLLGGAGARLETAVRGLENDGAMVRVRTLPPLPQGANLDAIEADMRADCRSWQSADGQDRKNNLVLLLLSYNPRIDKGKAGLYYGPQWSDRLDQAWPSILARDFVPPFKARDYVGAVEAAFGAVEREIAPPAPMPEPTPTAFPEPQQPQERAVVATGPTDYTLLWVLLTIAALIGIGIGAYVYAKAREIRRAAQRKAQAQKTACAARINALDGPLIVAKAKVEKVAKNASNEDVASMRSAIAELTVEHGRMSASFADMQSGTSNPDNDSLTSEEYLRIEGSYRALLAMLEEASAKRAQIEQDAAMLQSVIDGAQAAIEAVKAEEEHAAARIVAAQEKGFTTEEAETLLQASMDAVAKAERAWAEKRIMAMLYTSTIASERAKSACSSADGLAARKVAIDAMVVSLKERTTAIEASFDGTQAVYEAIAATYAESCARSIKGNGGVADDKCEEAAELVERAVTLADMKTQKWQEAEEALKGATAALDEAKAALDAVHALEANLKVASGKVKDAFIALASDLNRLEDYERAHDDDIADAIKPMIADVRASVTLTEAEIKELMPDPFAALARIAEVNKKIGTLYEKATDEHEAAKRQRQLAANAVYEADAAVSRASNYVSSHASDLDGNSAFVIDRASKKVNQAKASFPDLNTVIHLAGQAKSEANGAYNAAKAQVKVAEDRREAARQAAARRRREQERSDEEAAAALVSIASSIARSSSSRSSSSSSGGGFYGGSSRRGGGGSINIGSSSGGRKGGGGSIDI